MKVMVTGGCGFIGSNFVRFLLREPGSNRSPYSIFNIDKLTYAGNPENLEVYAEDPRYNFQRLDICDQERVREVLEWGPDVVVNFAAESHVDRSINGPFPFYKTNVMGTLSLLEQIRARGINLRFVQISTDEVYGSIKEGGFTESSPIKPSSPYSASKAAADFTVLAYWATYCLDTVVIRGSNNYGPYQYPEKVIPLFITNLMEDKKVPLYGDGKNIRDWVYVLDFCRAIEQVMHAGRPGEVYNVGGDSEIANVDLTKKILELLGKSEDMILPVEDRPGHDRRYAMNHTKLTDELGWSPIVNWDSGMSMTIEWYTTHMDWWRRLKHPEEGEPK